MFNLNLIAGRFRSDAEKRARPVENPTHRVFAVFEERFQVVPEEYSYDAILTQEEEVALKESGYEVIEARTEAAVLRGIQDVANGNVSSLGSFSQYADIEIDD